MKCERCGVETCPNPAMTVATPLISDGINVTEGQTRWAEEYAVAGLTISTNTTTGYPVKKDEFFAVFSIWDNHNKVYRSLCGGCLVQAMSLPVITGGSE